MAGDSASERVLPGRRSRLLLLSTGGWAPMDLPDRDLTRPLEAVGRRFIGFRTVCPL